MRLGGRRVHLASLVSLGCAVGFFRFFRGRGVLWGALWWSSGSSRVAGCTGVRSGWFILVRGVRWGAPLGSSGSSGVARLIGVRPVCCRVYLKSLGSVGCALGVVGFIPSRWVDMGAQWRSSVSSRVVGFIWARPGCRRVHPVAFGCALVIVGFIRGRWVPWSAPWGSSGSSGVAGFTGVRPWVRLVYPGLLHSLGCTLGVVHQASLGSFGRPRVHWGAPSLAEPRLFTGREGMVQRKFPL